jgi:hypothetical protein
VPHGGRNWFGGRCIFLEIFGSSIYFWKSEQKKYKKFPSSSPELLKKTPSRTAGAGDGTTNDGAAVSPPSTQPHSLRKTINYFIFWHGLTLEVGPNK